MSETEDHEKSAKLLWEAWQRLAMKIAERPGNQRQGILEITEQAVRETALMLQIAQDDFQTFVDEQMLIICALVAKIDLSGRPGGGNA